MTVCSHADQTRRWVEGLCEPADGPPAAEHAAGCDECRAIVADARAMRESVRAAFAAGAPEALRHRLGVEVAREARRLEQGRGGYRGGRFWFGTLCGAVAAAAVAAWLPLLARPALDVVVDEHVAALSAGTPYSVASSDHHTVRPWFAGRADVAPAVTDYSDLGFHLAGGRVARLGDHRVPVVVYTHGAHWIDVYSWPAGALPAPRATLRRGYLVECRRQGDLDTCAISDAAPAEVERLLSALAASAALPLR